MAQKDTSTKINVKAYRITANTAFSEKTLLQLVKKYTGRRSVAELEQAAQEITRFYREHGLLVARAYVPEQEITAGVITIAVLEGRYDQIDIQNHSRLPNRLVERTIKNPICDGPNCSGALIEEGSLERGLLLLSDTPGAAPSSRVNRGSQIGTSRLEVNAESTSLFQGVSEVSNYGNRYTGATRAATTLVAQNPFGFADQFLLQAVVSGHEAFGGAQYSVPLNYSGTRLALHFSTLDYALANEFAPLRARGLAQTVNADLTHPFIRSSNTNLTGTFSLAHNLLKDFVNLTASSNPRRISNAVAQLDANHADKWLGRSAITSATLAFTEGYLHFGNQVSSLSDSVTARSAGSFNKWNYSVSRLQQVTGRVALFTGLQGQAAGGNLDSFEKFFLGGPTMVRAYPVGEGSGDRGFVWSAEVRWSPGRLAGGATEVTGLYDYGISRISAQQFAAGRNDVHLHGPGFRLGWTSRYGVTLNSTVAFRGAQSFQSVPDSRFTAWLYASYRF